MYNEKEFYIIMIDMKWKRILYNNDWYELVENPIKYMIDMIWERI